MPSGGSATRPRFRRWSASCTGHGCSAAGRRARSRRHRCRRSPRSAPRTPAPRWIRRRARAIARSGRCFGSMANPEELVRRLAAAVRAGELYAPEHPLTRRAIGAVATAATSFLGAASVTVIGFVGDDVVVNDARITNTAGSFSGFARGLRDREIEKITVHRGVTADEWHGFVIELAQHRGTALADRLARRGVRRIVVGRLAVD